MDPGKKGRSGSRLSSTDESVNDVWPTPTCHCPLKCVDGRKWDPSVPHGGRGKGNLIDNANDTVSLGYAASILMGNVR